MSPSFDSLRLVEQYHRRPAVLVAHPQRLHRNVIDAQVVAALHRREAERNDSAQLGVILRSILAQNVLCLWNCPSRWSRSSADCTNRAFDCPREEGSRLRCPRACTPRQTSLKWDSWRCLRLRIHFPRRDSWCGRLHASEGKGRCKTGKWMRENKAYFGDKLKPF